MRQPRNSESPRSHVASMRRPMGWMALTMACLLALPAAALAQPARRSADQASVETTRAAADRLGNTVLVEVDRTLYTRAEHEANVAQVGEFRGGDVVVVSVTVGAVLLVGVIVLLILLLR